MEAVGLGSALVMVTPRARAISDAAAALVGD
jgi:hypothetical protein